MIIDLRSDTVTKPTKGMLEAMMAAEVGDDVYHEDPTVNALEQKVSDYFGTERSLFFPTGTMANQTAIKLHTQPGEQLICHEWAHVYNYEGGGASFNSGVSCKLLPGTKGIISAQSVTSAINPPDFYHSPLTSLVCVENTTNKGGGACYLRSDLEAIGKVCKKHSLRYHLDGARLWNALVKTGEDPTSLGKLFDTLSVCFSKGLGTPMGTVLTGTEESMEKAIRIRKILGGGMRQVGYMAAAALYAMDHHILRLKEDHEKAAEIAKTLNELSCIKSVEEPETNIVIFYVKEAVGEAKFLNYLSSQGVQISSMGEGKLRIVTHLDYSDTMHTSFLKILKEFKA